MKWLFLTLAILSVLIILPPIVHGYIYPSWGGDSAEHLIYFHNMDNQRPLYYGQYVIGKLLNALPIDINVSFLWFNYIVFVLIVWVIGLCTTFAVNSLAGILASILVAFGFFQTISLFGSGTIFDLMGIGILLPLALLCLHKGDKGIGWVFGAIICLASFACFHPNGKYVFALIPIVIIYELVRRQGLRVLTGLIADIWNNRYMMYLSGLVVALVFGYTVEIAKPNSIRLISDASILLMVILGSVLALVAFKKPVLQYVLVALAVVVSIPSINIYFQDNNLVQSVDKQAIAYLNSLPEITYATSEQVAQAVYGIYVKKVHIESNKADYAIVRSTPMGFRNNLGSSPNGYWLRSQELLILSNYMTTQGYYLLKEFDCGEKDRIKNIPIIIDVYGKDGNEEVSS